MVTKKLNFSSGIVGNIIDGHFRTALNNEVFEKVSPVTGTVLYQVARSRIHDVDLAVASAREKQPVWGSMPGVQRGDILFNVVDGLKENREEIAEIVALETGKSYKEALGETNGAIALGSFMAGEGQRLYGRTTTSGVNNKYAFTVRQPVGVAALIVAFNTPIANVAWKVFPALICGNTAVLKASEDTPATAQKFAEIALNYGLPPGVLNVVQGLGYEAGAALANHLGVDVISFTGSTSVGKEIAASAGQRLVKVSLELGGKNPLIVCDDADLENAARWVLLSAFSNAGQRCAAASRIIIFDSIYEKFRDMLTQKTQELRVGPGDEDDLGPVINNKQLNNILRSIDQAREQGASILSGGYKIVKPPLENGCFIAPTLIDNVSPQSEISITELFGPVACLYRVSNWYEALKYANDSPYGLTASIHTRDFNRAAQFAVQMQSGVVVINGGTYGSEPHMPFGGVKNSGNGWREPGTEALDVYSELKDIYINVDPTGV